MLLLDKPKGMTSHDVVNRVRRATGERRVGHGGTLDPNATGLLIVGVGREETKKLAEVSHAPKTYEAEIVLGAVSSTDDIEGEIKKQQAHEVDEAKVREILEEFVGKHEQVPPVYSAVKIKGKPAHRRVRKGEKVKLAARKVEIYSIEVQDYRYPILKLKCEVSGGTYIRALARDIGERLGTGAYLTNLRRTRIGEYDVREATKVVEL